MKYEKIKKIYTEEKEKQLKETIALLPQEGYEHLINYYLTDLRQKQLASGVITKEKAIELATRKATKENQKELKNGLKRIENVENAQEIDNISVVVEWTRNKTWGYNPHAVTFTPYVGQTHGTASGCGYDKESTAIAESFNHNNCILKIIFDMKEKALQNDINISSHDAIGYGAGYYSIPYFEGGVGTSCFIRILKDAGFTCSEIHGKSSDGYTFTKIA